MFAQSVNLAVYMWVHVTSTVFTVAPCVCCCQVTFLLELLLVLLAAVRQHPWRHYAWQPWQVSSMANVHYRCG